MVITQEMKDEYLQDVYTEMRRRGFLEEEIPRVIGKTGFMKALNECAEQQFHYDVSDAVNEIITVAAKY